MKKLLAISLLISGLTGCAAGIDNPKPAQLSAINQPLCAYGNLKKAPTNFSTALLSSLKNRGIQAHFVQSSELSNCSSILKINVRGDNEVVARARLTVVQNKQVMGSISYKNRGDETDRVKQVGLQSQTDLMVNALFK